MADAHTSAVVARQVLLRAQEKFGMDSVKLMRPLFNLALALDTIGNGTEATEVITRCYMIALLHQDIATQAECLTFMGVFAAHVFEYSSAEQAAFKALELIEGLERTEGNDQEAVHCKNVIGLCCRETGRPMEAAKHHIQALQLARKMGLMALCAEATSGLGLSMMMLEPPQDAVQVLKDAASLHMVAHGEKSEQHANALTEYGESMRNIGRYSDALLVLQQAHALFGVCGNVQSAKMAKCKRMLATTLYALKQSAQESYDLISDAVTLYHQLSQNDHVGAQGREEYRRLESNTLLFKGLVCERLERYDEAVAVQRLVVERFESAAGATADATRRMKHQLLRYETLLSSGGKVVLPEFGDLSSTLDDAAASSPPEEGGADGADQVRVGGHDGASGGGKKKGKRKRKRNKRRRDEPVVVAGVVNDNGAILEALAKSIDTAGAAASLTGSGGNSAADTAADVEVPAHSTAASDASHALAASKGDDASVMGTPPDQPLAGDANDTKDATPLAGEEADLDVSVYVDAQETLPNEDAHATSPRGHESHVAHADTDTAAAVEQCEVAGSPQLDNGSVVAPTVISNVVSEEDSEEDSEAGEGDANERHVAEEEARRHPSFTRLQNSYQKPPSDDQTDDGELTPRPPSGFSAANHYRIAPSISEEEDDSDDAPIAADANSSPRPVPDEAAIAIVAAAGEDAGARPPHARSRPAGDTIPPQHSDARATASGTATPLPPPRAVSGTKTAVADGATDASDASQPRARADAGSNHALPPDAGKHDVVLHLLGIIAVVGVAGFVFAKWNRSR
eukprot:m.831997 g.831997  ORF g.831997 m.831997 type:complete len:799 (+) comp23431_c0_seq4:194-2590(+)